MGTEAADRVARPATIHDVAAAAGVSRQTVTRAMNDLPDVSAATRQRVRDAAAALNYRPNRAAQRLVRGREITIGFVVGDLRNPYYPELASELTRRAAERDWGVLVVDVDGHGGERRIAAVAGRVDVVIGHLDPEHRQLVTSRVPTVLLADDDAGGARVRFDYDAAIDAAVRHLVATGHRRIAMLDSVGARVAQGPDGAGPARRSVRGGVLREVLRRHGLTPTAEVVAPAGREGGADAVRRLLDVAPGTDAVLCFNDVIAVSALRGLAHDGIRVPERIAVVGIDGLDLGTLVTPALTTLAVDMGELAAHALDLVDALLRGEAAEGLRRSVAHTLVLRESA